MAVVIPPIPVANSTTISLKSSAVDQTPYLGGPVQRLARMGDRWAYNVDCRPMHAGQAGPLIAALVQGLSAKVLCTLNIPGFDFSKYSNGAVVNGAGRTLTHSGGGAAKVVGQYFSLVKNGVRYVHMVTAVSGQTINFVPALKVPIAAGDVLEFGVPKIEGYLEGNEQNWTIGLVANLGLTFRINEAQ